MGDEVIMYRKGKKHRRNRNKMVGLAPKNNVQLSVTLQQERRQDALETKQLRGWIQRARERAQRRRVLAV